MQVRPFPSPSYNLPLLIAVLLMVGLLVARAVHQSITIDEATSFELWILPATPAYWDGASNNHILNSVLMKLLTTLFGVSHLSIRGPSLLGGFLYLLAVYFLTHLLTPRRSLQWVLFIWFGSSPFLLDYLVVARGYGLAAAMLLWALLVPACYRLRLGPKSAAQFRSIIVSSTCAGLSIAANFSFAIVAIFATLATTLWTHRRPQDAPRPPFFHWAAVFAAAAVPAFLVLFTLAGHAVLNWPAGQLWWGAKSLRATFETLIESALFQPNPYLLNPLLLASARNLQPYLLPALGAALAVHIAFLSLRRHPVPPESSWRREFAIVVSATLVCTVLSHYATFRFFHTLLPQERTAFYIPLLCGLLVAIFASEGTPTRAGRVTQSFLLFTMFAVGLYFVSCLRLGYFKEWEWDADVQRAYSVVARHSHEHSRHRIASSWHYSAVLNFYRVMHQNRSLAEVSGGPPYSPAFDIYVLHAAFDAEFLQNEKLRVIYKGDSTELVVAVRDTGATSKAP